jgi:short-subunit dehydrogenase
VKDLGGQVVLLTGSAGGFGRALTRLLLREGCALILADLSREAAVAAAEEAARAVGPGAGRVLGFAGVDLSRPEGADELYADATRISPRVDMLINNAGLAVYGRVDHIPPQLIEQLMQVNLLAPMRLSRLCLPQMVGRGSGHIVNIASCAGLVGWDGLSVYSASKFGLRGFGEALARDLRGSGVDVTTIYPFFTRTAILHSPQYGLARRHSVPEPLVGHPDIVMAALVRGIRKRQLHIYPGFIARQIDLLRRVRA